MMKRTIFSVVLLLMLVTAPYLWQPHAPVVAQGGPTPSDVPRYQTGNFPRAMAFDGIRVWVANWLDNSITRLLAADGRVLDTKVYEPNKPGVIVGRRPVALAWDGTHMWVANYLDNNVIRIDKDDQVVSVFGPNSGIQSPVALFYDGAHIWVVNQGGGITPGTVTKIEIGNTVNVLGSYRVGVFPTAMTWDGDYIWVANGRGNSVSVLDSFSGQLVKEIPVNLFPMSIVFDGIHVWVSHYDGSIALIRKSTLQIDETIVIDDLPGNPGDLISPRRPIQILYAFEHIWITNTHFTSFTSIDALQGIVVKTVEVGDSEFPATLAYTNQQVWVANWLSSSITTYDPDGEILINGTYNNPTAVALNPGIWLPTSTPSPTPTPTITPTPCDSRFPPRLIIGERGMVNSDYGTQPLRLRDQPGSDNTRIIKTYGFGTTFTVLDGPVCIDNRAWFQVEISDDKNVGWFAETLETSYTVDPLPASR